MSDNTNTTMPDLDVPSGRFWAEHVKPGTAYADEPSEEVSPGWYVVGNNSDDGLGVIVKVEEAWGVEGEDRREALAEAVAALLTRGY